MIKISAVVITFNEEDCIARCIRSLKPVADEIVIIDSYSKDRTRDICLAEGVRFIEHPFEGHIQQKNYGLKQATHEWVLSLDADEFLSDELTKSIADVKNNTSLQAYSMNRLTGISGRYIRSTDWYPDKKIRLWNKSIGVWGGYNPHDTVILKPGTALQHITGNLMHDGYVDYADLMSKANQYARIFARANQHKKSSSIFKALYKSFYTFIRNYIIKYGFVDGVDGLVISVTNTYYTFFKYAILRELNQEKKNPADRK